MNKRVLIDIQPGCVDCDFITVREFIEYYVVKTPETRGTILFECDFGTCEPREITTSFVTFIDGMVLGLANIEDIMDLPITRCEVTEDVEGHLSYVVSVGKSLEEDFVELEEADSEEKPASRFKVYVGAAFGIMAFLGLVLFAVAFRRSKGRDI